MSERILIVDDEPPIVELVAYNLQAAGFEVIAAKDGIEALDLLEKENPDLVLLDIMLPELDGFSVCQRMRRTSNVPIVMLTARGGETDKVWGLEIGADDYITKPFSPKEMVARVKAVLRRRQESSPDGNVLQSGDLTVDLSRRTVVLGGKPLELTPKEFDLLRYLLQHRGIVITRDQLLKDLWGYDYAGETRTVDVHIRRLRSKMDDDGQAPRHIETVHGIGYRMRDT